MSNPLVFLTADVFINNYNKEVLHFHPANMDIQYVTDEYAVAEYVTDYCTKLETGQSAMLKDINDQAISSGESFQTTIEKLAKELDKGREVSEQEATYRILGLPMTKFSEKVKFVNTNHPNHREGLLRSNIDELSEGESIFHFSLHDYYQARPNEGVDVEWEDMTLAEFAANYEIHSTKPNSKNCIKLQNKMGYIVKRRKECVIRYFLKYENETEYYRALCILFLPFRNEMSEIHAQDVELLYKENEADIELVRSHYEKFRNLTDTIRDIEQNRDNDEEDDEDDINDDDFVGDETTSEQELKDFNKFVASQASKQVERYNEGKSLMQDDEYLQLVNSLNMQQRKIFDDFVERIRDQEECEPFYLYIGGEAGTGKSFLLRLMIEAVNRLPRYSGQTLGKPFSITMAPTGIAACNVKGSTIESALGMQPQKRKSCVGNNASRNSNFRFLYEDLKVIVLDEVSMCGSDKLTRINYRMQEIMGNSNFMGGVSVVATGDFGQLPPVGESMIWEKSYLDGRLDVSPNHWDEHFSIFYLTEKMRSQDEEFSRISDKVRKGICDPEVLEYMQNHIKTCPNENDNSKYAEGKLLIVVTNNYDRDIINSEKLEALLPNEKAYSVNSTDVSTNRRNAPSLPENLPHTQTGQLESKVILKKGAPVMITSNHSEQRYKNNGIVNGSRGYIDSIQVAKDNPDQVEVIWICFNDENTGQLLREDNKHLLRQHKPNNPLAVPIKRQKKQFQAKGSTSWLREQFPVTLCYAITAHKSQGQTLHEVIIDFSSKSTRINAGSFYTAMSRVRFGDNLYLKDFKPEYIHANKSVEKKIEAMKISVPYQFKKVLLDTQISEDPLKEIKIGYININS